MTGSTYVVNEYSFLGLPIAIETPQGTYRHWKDPHNNTSGKSYMHHDYGFVRGTLGTDGDEVDVYIGPSSNSNRVFVVTQMKAPDFCEVDEQKVMLGFDTREQAVEAYLYQYDDPRFLGGMQEISLQSFKEQLVYNKGCLIKALNSITASAKIPTRSISEKNMSKPEDLLKSVSSKLHEAADQVNQKTEEMSKALTANAISGMVRRMRLHEYATAQAYDTASLGTNRTRLPGEPPVVPVRRIESVEETRTFEAFSNCTTCDTVHKSTSECPRCAFVKNVGSEAKPFRFRGR